MMKMFGLKTCGSTIPLAVIAVMILLAMGMGNVAVSEAGNDFSQDSACVALWNFESGSLVTDSKGNNDLINSGADVDTIKYRQGACSAEFARSVWDTMIISDAVLDSGFPLKFGESNKSFSFAFWIYLNTVNIDQTCFGKGQSPPQYSTIVRVRSNNRMSLFVSQDGTTHNWYAHSSTLRAGRWYHVGITYDNSDYSYRIRIWDDVAQAILGTDLMGTAVDIHVDMTPFICSQKSPLLSLDGNLDELVVFNDVLSADEIDQIRQGAYGAEDNETPSFTVIESDGGTRVSESGTTDTFQVVLDTEPESEVVIDVTVGDASEATVDLWSLTFTQADWAIPQTVTVTGEDDDFVDGDQTTWIMLSINDAVSDDAFDGVADHIVSVTTTDDDVMTGEGLVAHWPLDEGVGFTTRDATGHGYIGTLLGDVTFTDGVYNKAVEFGGTDGIITFGNIDYQFSDSLTVALWARFSGTVRGYQSLIQKDPYCRPFMIWRFGSLLRVVVRTVDDVYYLLSRSSLQVDAWYHVAVTYEDGRLSVYIDGRLDSEMAASGTLVEIPETTTMGNSAVGGGHAYDGGLDEVYIYNRALSAGEIESLAGQL